MTVFNAAAFVLSELDLQVTRGTEGYKAAGVEEGNCWALLVLEEMDLNECEKDEKQKHQ